MTPPAASTASAPESDAFVRVGRALIACWCRWQAYEGAAPTRRVDSAQHRQRQRNELLDETGSDFRPLVDLLLDLGQVVRPALRAVEQSPLSASAWETHRAPLVHHIVSTRYLQPDVARWAVDVWARALGVSPVPAGAAPIASPMQISSAESTHHTPQTGPSQHGIQHGIQHGTQGLRTRASARPNFAPPRVATAARPNAPSWAGGPVALGVGAKVPPGVKQALASSGRLVRGPLRVSGPRFQPIERVAGVVLLGLLVVITISLKMALGRQRSQVPAAATPTAGSGTQKPVSATPSTIRTPSFAEPVEAHGEALVPLSTPSLESLRVRGVAGRYRVTQRIESVDGSESCVSVAQALGVGRTSDERITHDPGSVQFRLDSRGVAGTLSADGDFVAGPVSGTLNNIPWTFRMRGRFLPDGFTGESQTFTQAIIRWGRMQSCVVTASLDAVRLPG